MTDLISMSEDRHVATVRLNRPDKLNALTVDMFIQIAETIARLSVARHIRAVVLTGEGRAFCAGLDMSAMAGGGSGLALDERPYGAANIVQQAALGWRNLPMPVVAAVQGVAFGGGLQIMAGADIRIAHPATRFSIREVHWGLVPDMAGPTLWSGLVREDALRELTYTAREFDAPEAERLGFVTRISDDPLCAAHELAHAIAARPPSAVAAAKRLYNVARHADAATLLAAETSEQLRLKGSRDQIEAVAAQLEGRVPAFGTAGLDEGPSEAGAALPSR